MPTATAAPLDVETVGELIARLGGIDPDRILWKPSPGTATEKDLLAVVDGDAKRLCELVDGTLVEKAMGMEESFLAITLAGFLNPFLRANRLGKLAGADALVRMSTGNVRLPDLAFFSRERWQALSNRKSAIASIRPDLAVEVLSRKNTRKELARKRREYFTGGTRLVWQIDPRQRIVAVYSSPTEFTTLTESDILTGGAVLPGFKIPLTELFNDPNDTE